MFNKNFIKVAHAPMVAAIITSGMLFGSAAAADDESVGVAFPDKYMVRLGAYIVDNSNTQFSVNSDLLGLGTTIDYQRDLGGASSDTIPRIDAYYRFNERHRIDFTSFVIDRKGSRVLDIDPPITIGDEDFSGGTINSSVKYTLYKLGYGYSFYHSPEVELSLSAGLNIMDYDLAFSNAGGDKRESVGATVPLPVFGLRMGYAITPKWSIQYVAESFAIDIDDTLRGNLFNYEINTEYRIFKNFAIGAGIVRLGLDVEVNDEDWRGAVSDSYRGFTAFGTLYF